MKLAFVLIIVLWFIFALSGCKQEEDGFKNSPNAPQQPLPTTTPTPVPLPSPTPWPEVDGVKRPNHEMSFGYYFVDGRYGDFWNEVDCYTNLYTAWARRGYEPSSDATDDEWLPLMDQAMARAAAARKHIYLMLNLQDEAPGRVTPLNRVLDMSSNYWNNVSYIELADEPGWTKAQTEERIRDLQTRLRARGLPDKPFGVVYTRDQVINENAIFASNMDWVGIEAYIDPPGSNDSAKNVKALKDYVNKAKARVPQNKDLVIVMMAYARNGGWTNMTTLRDLQMPAYELSYDDPRVLALTMFSYGRPSGTRENSSLRPIHRKIGNAIQNSSCRP